MLVLLDENLLSRKLKQPLIDAGYTVYNVDNMGWRGTKDRDLLALADAYPFDVFIQRIKIYPINKKLVITNFGSLFSILKLLSLIIYGISSNKFVQFYQHSYLDRLL